ncbi:MAG: guanylate kinase [Nitrospira sp.]|nr:guanylate kinase [Nitrospira sp.]
MTVKKIITPKSSTVKKTNYQPQGSIFVLSAPSGAGKTTLAQQLMKNNSNLVLSVSYTTREPRDGEQNDIDYTFISEAKFQGMIEKNEFAEWALVHGNMYGTSVKRLKKMTRDGYDIILDIDTDGAAQLRNSIDNAVYIFILPPSLQILQKRLTKRKTDTKETIEKRMNNAKAEIACYKEYDFVIINDKYDKAYSELEAVIQASRFRVCNADHKWIKKELK